MTAASVWLLMVTLAVVTYSAYAKRRDDRIARENAEPVDAVKEWLGLKPETTLAAFMPATDRPHIAALMARNEDEDADWDGFVA